MTPSHWIRIAWVALVAFVSGRFLLAYDMLPEYVASHFDHAGRADGHDTKGGFVGFVVVFQVLLTGLPLLLSSQLHKRPDTKLNVPHRDYWLAPERRLASLRRLASFVDAMALALALLIAVLAELTVRAQLSGGPMPISPAIPLALFVAFTVGWVVRMRQSFPPPPAQR